MKKAKRTGKIIKRILLGFAAFVLVVIITAGIVLYGRLATILSVKQAGDQLYTVKFQQDYHLDKALSAGIKTENDLFRFVCDEMFFGYQIRPNAVKYACSAFLTDTPDGKRLVGRNFDYHEAETLEVYTQPSGGYASIASADLDFIGVGAPNSVETMSTLGKIATLAAPYLCVDGVNEKGLSVSVLNLNYEETHERNNKPDLIIPVAVRLLLDRAANVDEAVKLLGNYNIHTGHGVTQHLFIADKSGNAVVTEWHRGLLKVVKSPICTNFRLSSKVAQKSTAGICDRFDKLRKSLKNRPKNNEKQAMSLLKDVSVDWTQWSCVYSLDDFCVDIAVDLDYKNAHRLTPSDF